MMRVFLVIACVTGAVASFPALAAAEEETTEPGVDYGAAFRLRQIYVPEGVLEVFVKDASSGVSHTGFGAEVIRRHGEFELSLGVEYEHINPEDGLWLEKGDDPGVPGQQPDYVEFKNFRWLAADITFAWHKPINEMLAFRYGAGFGLGVVMGQVLQTDTQCTNSDIGSCTPYAAQMPGVQYKDEADLPPVFPVINLLLGLQVRPADNISIDVEVGLRSVAYAGTSIAYFF